MFRFLIAKQPEGYALVIGGNRYPTLPWAFSSIEKFSFVSHAVSAGQSMAVTRGNLGALGTKTHAIAIGGINDVSSLQTTEKYNFAANTVTYGPNLSTANWGHVGAGNSTIGILNGAYGTVSSVIRYTYSSDTMSTSGTGTTYSCRSGAGAGNETVAIFAGGYYDPLGSPYLNTAKTYTYASDVVSNASSLTELKAQPGGAGTSTDAYFFGGSLPSSTYSNKREKYSLSTYTNSAANSLANARGYTSSAGDVTKIVTSGGESSSPYNSAYTDVYIIASDTSSASSLLSTGKRYTAGVSTTPGHM